MWLGLVPFHHVAKPGAKKKRKREGVEMGKEKRRGEKQRGEGGGVVR